MKKNNTNKQTIEKLESVISKCRGFCVKCGYLGINWYPESEIELAENDVSDHLMIQGNEKHIASVKHKVMPA